MIEYSYDNLPREIGMSKQARVEGEWEGSFPGCRCKRCSKDSRTAKLGKRNKKQKKYKEAV